MAKRYFLLLSFIMIHGFAHADLDQHDEQGLRDTQQFLKTPKDREEFLKTDPKARSVDKKVESLSGSSKNKEEIYGIAADVFEKIVRETNGDTQKMQKLLEEAQANPEKFYQKYFDDNAKARVRGVATDIERHQPSRVGSPK